MLAAVLGALLLVCCSPPEPPVAEPDKAEKVSSIPLRFAPGATSERRLAAGERHEYRLPLAAGQYLQLRIEQPGLDIAARLTGPDGRLAAAADDPDGLDPEYLALIARESGEHRLVLSPRNARKPGLYRLRVEELRPAGRGDTARVAAEQVLAEGRRLMAGGDSECGQSDPRQYARVAQQALARFEEALAKWRDAADPAGQARALLQIGDVQREEQHARRAYTEALSLWEQLGDVHGEGAAYAALGVLALNGARVDEAFRHLNDALPLLRSANDLVGQARLHAGLSGVHYDRGEIGTALDLAVQALSLVRAGRRAPDVEFAVLQSLGRIHKLRGEQELALVRFQEAVSLGVTRYEARALYSIGSTYHDLGELDAALAAYQRARTLSHRCGDPTQEARALTLIGWLRHLQEAPESALEQYDRALALLQGSGSSNTGNTEALTLRYAALAHTALGRPRVGLDLLLRALALRRESGTLADEARSLLDLAVAYRDLGEASQAVEYFKQAFQRTQQIQGTALEAECLFQWARLERDQGRLEEALDRIDSALDIIESVRSRVSSEDLRASFFATKRDYYELYLDLLLRVWEAQKGRGGEAAAAAFEVSERARARGLLDLLARLRIDVQPSAAPDLQRREAEIRARLAWLQGQLEQKQVADRAALLSQMAQTLSEQSQWLEKVRRSDPVYAEMRYPTPLGLTAVQALLDPDTALLQYFLGREGSFLFVVTAQEVQSRRLPNEAEIAAQVVDVLELLQQRGGTFTLRQYQREASELYDVLLGPAVERLVHKRRLLIAPDGILYLLPFEALLSGREGSSYRDLPYLLRRHVVSYVPSASVLADLRRPRPALPSSPGRSKALLAFASSGSSPELTAAGTFHASASQPLPPLPFARAEVEEIARLYPGEAEVYVGKQATEGNVKRSLAFAGARRIHFATHGIIDERTPRLSGLELADGRLQMDEIFQMKLRSDLLVLSACDTGRGKTVRGEGIIGLTRAFLYAGARSLVVSLWRVSDRSTADLMVRFYRRLDIKGQSKADALHAAKLSLLQERNYAAPYHWAPFVVTGDPR